MKSAKVNFNSQQAFCLTLAATLQGTTPCFDQKTLINSNDPDEIHWGEFWFPPGPFLTRAATLQGPTLCFDLYKPHFNFQDPDEIH